MFWVWLAVIAVAIIIEIITLDLISVWFSFGAIIPFILSAIGGIPIEIQLSIFVVVSVLLIIFLRKLSQKILFKNMDTKTNIHAQEGKRYRLLEETDFDKNGTIKINDVFWTAVSENGEKIEKGELVEIVKIEGNKMFVKKVDKEDQSKQQQNVETNDNIKSIEKENISTNESTKEGE